MKASTILLVLFTGFLALIIASRNLGFGDSLFAGLNYIPGKDKLGHFILMGILSFLAVVSLARRIKLAPKRAAVLVATIVFFIVTLEELSQMFIASRSFSLGDLACDAAGILIFGWLGYWCSFVRKA